MANKFKVGDRVEFVDDPKDPLTQPRSKEWQGFKATVTQLLEPLYGELLPERVQIVWDVKPPGEYYKRESGRTIRESRLRLIEENIVAPSPFTRGGYKVTDIYSTPDKDRPFSASVHLPSGRRTLTFSASGHFFDRVDLPVDLVNA